MFVSLSNPIALVSVAVDQASSGLKPLGFQCRFQFLQLTKRLAMSFLIWRSTEVNWVWVPINHQIIKDDQATQPHILHEGKMFSFASFCSINTFICVYLYLYFNCLVDLSARLITTTNTAPLLHNSKLEIKAKNFQRDRVAKSKKTKNPARVDERRQFPKKVY